VRIAGDEGLLSAARSILQRIHSKGVIHGDLREDNLIVTHQGGSCKVWLLDFSHCRFSNDAAAQEQELCELEDLFHDL
jgi:tRNA A-37 threonylcarbamoyl transferase component Bud32